MYPKASLKVLALSILEPVKFSDSWQALTLELSLPFPSPTLTRPCTCTGRHSTRERAFPWWSNRSSFYPPSKCCRATSGWLQPATSTRCWCWPLSSWCCSSRCAYSNGCARKSWCKSAPARKFCSSTDFSSSPSSVTMHSSSSQHLQPTPNLRPYPYGITEFRYPYPVIFTASNFMVSVLIVFPYPNSSIISVA